MRFFFAFFLTFRCLLYSLIRRPREFERLRLLLRDLPPLPLELFLPPTLVVIVSPEGVLVIVVLSIPLVGRVEAMVALRGFCLTCRSYERYWPTSVTVSAKPVGFTLNRN